jgi:tricorn protease
MKRSVLSGVLVLLVAVGVLYSAQQARFMAYPDIHGDQIVFTYEGDLWLASSKGGQAFRITTFPGTEYAAKFSPDGQWIAFSGEYDGSESVYLIPADGGEPVRLTYNPGSARTLTWTPDGQKIVFRSFFEVFIKRDPNLYVVHKDGSAPERLPLDRGVLCSFSPDGKKILYCRKGREEYQWKRYKGGRYQDIWMYDFDSKTFTPVSDYVGKNSYPMWVGDRMFFVSDREGGIANLFVQDLQSGEVEQVTRYGDFDVMMPSTDGRKVVYIQDGHIHILDTGSREIEKVEVTVQSDRWQLRNRHINPKDYIHYFTPQNGGKQLALEARGDIFILPTGEKGRAVNLSRSPGTREMYPQISPDGQWLAFFSDKTGEYQLYIQKLEGGEWQALTDSLNCTNYELLWSPDSSKILFGNKEFAIFVVDVKSKKMRKIDASNQLKNDQFYWKISDYNWSPDSRWVCYSLVQFNRNSQIFLYSLEQNRRYALTGDFYDNLNPCFDANGRYLYYLSSRNFDVQMDFYEDNHVISNPQQVMVVQLQAGQRPPFLDDGEDSPQEAQKGQPADFRIDIEGIETRTFPLPLKAGNYFYLKAGDNKVMYCSVPRFTQGEYEEIFEPGGRPKWDLHIFDMPSKEEIVLPQKIGNYRVSTDGKQLAVQIGPDFYAVSVEEAFKKKKLAQKLSLDSMVYEVDCFQEWQQIFSDTWRWYREFFYDGGMHGHDWQAIGDTYRAALPYLSSRRQLNWLLSQMVGELCVGHAYIFGGDNGPSKRPESKMFTGLLAADLTPDPGNGYYRFDKIYGPTRYDLEAKAPLCRPDMDVKEGDYLLAINGHRLKAGDDYFKFLQVTAGQKVEVTVNRQPTFKGARTYEVEPLRRDRRLRYLDWLTHNIDTVLQASNGRVGYMHINAMGAGGIGEFDKFWRAFRYKEGIIIDVRRNSGGWTEYFLIDKLERKMVAYNNLKAMVPFRYPGSVSNGKFVVISNEYNGSDGEAFVEHFKTRKLGTVVGVPSWGGLVGIINGQRTIDNGIVHQPNNAFYGREGKWWVENHGADPDIWVDNDPASVMAGRDLQLEKAIEVILQQIEQDPFKFPPKPPYPKR